MAEKKIKRHEIPADRAINMTPLIDVVFQLLIFFMVASSLVKPNQIELDLPKSTSGTKAQADPAHTLTYKAEADQAVITFDGEPVRDLPHLAEIMHALRTDAADQPRVDLQFDRSVPIQDALRVIDTLRDSGFPKFSMVTLAEMGPQR